VIPTLPRSALARYATAGYVVAFFVFLFLPLAVVTVFAFNNANYPAPPWRGFTLDARRGRREGAASVLQTWRPASHVH